LSYIGFLLKNASQSNLKVANVTANVVGTGAVTIAGMRSVLGAVATVAAAGPYFATATVSGNTVNVTVYAATCVNCPSSRSVCHDPSEHPGVRLLASPLPSLLFFRFTLVNHLL